METIENRVVACARGWIGTRFHHQGRLRATSAHSGGVDCLGLLIGIARELDLTDAESRPLAAHDRTDYGHIPDGSILLGGLAQHLQTISVSDITPGDILLFRLDGIPRHLGIVSEKNGAPHLIHAYAQARKVIEQTLDEWWQERIAHAFRIPNL